MPRRRLLTPAERAALLAFPTTDDALIQYYTFSESDLSAIRQRRGQHNRLGFAVPLCYLRYPGFALPPDAEPPVPLLSLVGRQLRIEPAAWSQYAHRPETRREHLTELLAWLKLTPFSVKDSRRLVHQLTELARQTDRGMVLAQALVEMLRQQRILLPALDVIERVCSEARTRGTRQVYEALTAPRIRDLADKRLYIHGTAKQYPTLAGLIGGSSNVKHIRAHWDEILRLAASIRQGTVTASLMLRKLGSYPRQNGLALALRELGRMERTLFTLDWMQNVNLRRRVQIGLNKGEAKNALARAVFFNRLGELRDRSFENQRYRASGLNLVVAAIILWNTVYLDRAIQALRATGQDIDAKLLPHLSPLGWEHINLTGDYGWHQNKLVAQGKFRPLRVLDEA